METLFGIPMVSIMVAMVGLLLACVAVVAFIAWRRPVIFKLGIRNIPRRKAQTVLIVLGLMLSTLIIAAALGTGDTLNRSVSSAVYDQLGPVDELVVRSTNGDGEGSIDSMIMNTIPEDSVQFVRDATEDSGAVDAVGGILVAVSPALNIADKPFGPTDSMNSAVERAVQSEPVVLVAGIDTTSFNELGGTDDLDGTAVNFDDLGERGVLMSETGADALDARVGDTVVVSLNNAPVALEIMAIAADSVLTGSLDGGNAPAMAMQLVPLQNLTAQEGRISGVGISNTGGVRDGLDRTDDVVDVLKPQLAQQDLGINTIKQDFVEQAELIANVFVTFFIVFGLFSIAVGILLIVLIFTMLAAERRSEMGMERAVGAQRRQLIQQFISEGTGYALLAGLIGTAMGALAVLGIAYGIGQAFGDFITISPFIEPQSLIIAYSLGVVITFLAVTISSWRVSRLNVVAAVRDIPDAYEAHRNRKLLIWGIVMLIAGPALIVAAQPGDSLFLFTSGMTLIPFGLAAIASYFGVHPRLVLTIAGLYSLAFWLLPGDWFEAIFGTYEGDIEMFFLSGIAIVASSTLVIIQNLDWILSATMRLGGRLKGWFPSVRLAVSYPGANKGRTGMTIAMFSLIVFSLVMVASINENFAAAFLGDDAAAGWDVSVETTRTNPIPDLESTLGNEGFDTSEIRAVGAIEEPADASSTQLRNPGDDEWSTYGISVMNASYLENADVSFSGRANGYDSDSAIIDALKTESDVVVIDSFALPGSDAFGPPSGFQLEGASSDGSFDAPKVEMQLPDGSVREVRVIGVISATVSTLFGVFMGPDISNALYSNAENPLRTYYLQLADGVDSGAVAKDIERALLPFGAQAVDIYQDMQDQQQQQRSFLYVMQGFMGLGLVVGVAAVGVIAFRAVVERRQQIGMLRALGFQQVAVARAFVMESAMIVILGVVSGGVTGMILAWSLITSDEFSAAPDTPFIIPWTLIIVTLVTSIVAALLMAWLPARQASRIVPAEALRYE